MLIPNRNSLWVVFCVGLVGQNCNLANHAEGVYEIRSLSAVWNQHEVLNVINPKEKYTLTRDAMPSFCDGFHTPCG